MMRVLVTGGAAGIGLAIAQKCAREGAEVYVCDVSAEALHDCLAANPGLYGSVADISEPKDAQAAVREAEALLGGGLDLLVNNAGIAGPKAPVQDIPVEEFDRTIKVNLCGMFYVAKYAIPAMKAQRSGCIINISTSSARTGLPLRTPYVVSKSGVLGLTLNLARELGPFGIRCNAILPGAVDNPRGRRIVAEMAEKDAVTSEEMEQKMLSFISMRSWVEPSEVADMAYFLASDECRHVTGQLIGVCGNVEWEG